MRRACGQPPRATEPVISHACNCCSCSYVCRRCRCFCCCCCAFKGQRLSAQQSIHNHKLRLSCAFLHRLRLPQVAKIASTIENDRDCNIAHCHKLPLIRSMRCQAATWLDSTLGLPLDALLTRHSSSACFPRCPCFPLCPSTLV